MTIVTITLNPSIDRSFRVNDLVAERKLEARDVRHDPGGGGINVARVAQRLGGEVLALWTCGGTNGQRLGRLLDAEGIPHWPIAIEGEVRENLVVGEDSSEQQFRFGFRGPDLHDTGRAHWTESLRDGVGDATYVVFSGSVPGDTDREWYAERIRAIPDEVRVVVDTKGGALHAALDAGVFLAKPNVDELADFAGRELNSDAAIEDAARELIDAGRAEVMLVSLGRAGALLATADGVVRLPSPSVRPRSKIGAGDSMVGGLVQALDAGEDLGAAARQAVAAGAAAVMTPGTELCRADDVARLRAALDRRKER